MLVVEPPKPLPRYKVARIEPPTLKPRTKKVVTPLPPPKPSNIEEITARNSTVESCSIVSSFDDDTASCYTSFDESSSIYETSLVSLISTKIETPILPLRNFTYASNSSNSDDEVSYDPKPKPPEIVAVFPKVQPRKNQQRLPSSFETLTARRGFRIGCSMLSLDDYDKSSINSFHSDADSLSLYSINPKDLNTEDVDEIFFKGSKSDNSRRNSVQNEFLGMNAAEETEKWERDEDLLVSGNVGNSLVVGDLSDKGM